jgi:hypothetical protein
VDRFAAFRQLEQPSLSVHRHPFVAVTGRGWCRLRGLNPRPSVYKTAALPLS